MERYAVGEFVVVASERTLLLGSCTLSVLTCTIMHCDASCQVFFNSLQFFYTALVRDGIARPLRAHIKAPYKMDFHTKTLRNAKDA